MRRTIMERIITQSTGETRELASNFAKELLKKEPQEKALVLSLEGDLGSGKTTFLQGFAKGLNIKEKILSPTFVILKRFPIPSRKKEKNKRTFKNFFHVDCYRIHNEKEILSLNLKKILSEPENIVAIEWGKRIKKLLPRSYYLINFKFLDKNKREIIFKDIKK